MKNMKAAQMTIHGGCAGTSPKAPKNMGVKGMTSVSKDAIRKDTVKNMIPKGNRNA